MPSLVSPSQTDYQNVWTQALANLGARLVTLRQPLVLGPLVPVLSRFTALGCEEVILPLRLEAGAAPLSYQPAPLKGKAGLGWHGEFAYSLHCECRGQTLHVLLVVL